MELGGGGGGQIYTLISCQLKVEVGGGGIYSNMLSVKAVEEEWNLSGGKRTN